MKPLRCRMAGCRRKPHAQGLCQQHYDRQRKSTRRAGGALGRPAVSGPVRPAAEPAAAALSAEAALAGKLCCVPGCTAAHHAKGYCKSHYGQLRRHGGVLGEGGEPDGKPVVLTKDRRLVEIIKRHEILKKEISSIHKELESEAHED